MKNVVPTSDLNPGGNGQSPPYQYQTEDILHLQGLGATSGTELKARYTPDQTGDNQTTPYYGLNNVGAQIGHAALPCPRYCPVVGGEERNASPQRWKKKMRSAAEATYFLENNRWTRPKKPSTRP